ncbi:MAG: hypothetical protein ACXV8X_12155 [Candidatus Angelobacter sp.]
MEAFYGIVEKRANRRRFKLMSADQKKLAANLREVRESRKEKVCWFWSKKNIRENPFKLIRVALKCIHPDVIYAHQQKTRPYHFSNFGNFGDFGNLKF